MLLEYWFKNTTGYIKYVLLASFLQHASSPLES